MALSEIETLLQSAMGLKVSTIGHSTLDRAVNRRMKALNLDNQQAYVTTLQERASELSELIEEVVVPETWFIRDSHPFTALLGHLAGRKYAASRSEKVLRLLSAPCATGEEPYSMAITLLQAGWQPHRFKIYAMDISTRALARAKKAEYTEHSFRGGDLAFRSHYFKKIGSHFVRYLLDDEVRRNVYFQHGNLLDPGFMDGLGVFDILFCRNVLIYLDQKAREQAIATLHRMLDPNGLLVVGHAEACLFNDRRFKPAPYPRAFAFYKRSRLSQEVRPTDPDDTNQWPNDSTAPPPKPSPRRTQRRASTPGKRHQAAGPEKRVTQPAPEARAKNDVLLRVRQMADQGKLKDARLLCETYLRQQGPSAPAFFLLGVIHDAVGNIAEATTMLHKAVYLDPNHMDALVLLTLIADRDGKTADATTYKRRIHRLQGGQQKKTTPRTH